MIFNFFKQKNECKHLRVPIDVDEAYCPDCGAYIQNKWFLVRCNCCNIKRTAHFEYNNIKPDTKYCPNCGSTDFYVEEIENMNCTNVHYAIFKKIIIPQEKTITRQIWIEKDSTLLEEKKLLKIGTHH